MSSITDLVSKLKTVLTARNFDNYSDDYLIYEIEQAINTNGKINNINNLFLWEPARRV